MRSEASGTQPASPVAGLSDLTVLARGGYSTVYRARQDSIGREVALKIDTRALESERDRRRFVREAEAAGRMSGHPNVVNIYDAGVTEDNHPYLVMELCTGGSYATRLRENGPLSPSEVRDVGVKIADALQAAHEAGILHRDVKPGNILINRYGVPGLADFGLAALPDPSRELSVTIEALTPAYAPPEVFRMETPTPLGDQYSLAASLYALLSGRPPRWPETGTPSLATMVQILDEPVPDVPGAPEGLSNVLRQAMAAYADDRYSSAAEFRDALAALDLSAAGGSRPLVTPPAAPPTGSPTSGGFGAPAPPSWSPQASAPPYNSAQPSAPPYGSGQPSGQPYGGPPSGPPYSSGQPYNSGPHYNGGPPNSGAPYNGYGTQTSGGPTYAATPPSTARPTSVFPSNTFGPTAPYGSPPPSYGSPSGPPPSGPGGPGTDGSGRRGAKRGLVVTSVVVAVLVVVAGIGFAINSFVNGTTDRPDGKPPTASPGPGGPNPGNQQSDNGQQNGKPSQNGNGQLPSFPGLPSVSSTTSVAYNSTCAAAKAGAPAAAQATCPTAAECWGARSTQGTASTVDCAGSHLWETFVIGTLSSGTDTSQASSVENDPNVAKLCTSSTLRRAMKSSGQQWSSDWRVKIVIPGTSNGQFHCVAGKNVQLSGSSFVKS